VALTIHADVKTE